MRALFQKHGGGRGGVGVEDRGLTRRQQAELQHIIREESGKLLARLPRMPVQPYGAVMPQSRKCRRRSGS